MERRLLSRNQFDKLYEAFCLAFSNYQVNLSLTKDEFDIRIHKKLNIDYSISAGSYDGDEMIGFILHTHNIYEGIPTAFNGGTGVLPGFRNQQTAEELYDFLIPKIAEKQIARVLLEVIDSNEQAIRLYEKVGFTFRRKFLCYKLENPKYFGPLKDETVPAEKGDVLEDFADFEPSFVDSKNQLAISDEEILKIDREGEIAGYISYHPVFARISQIAVAREYRRKGLGSLLIKGAVARSKKKLTIMNVPEDEFGFQQFLNRCGFENQVNQFEMELII